VARSGRGFNPADDFPDRTVKTSEFRAKAQRALAAMPTWFETRGLIRPWLGERAVGSARHLCALCAFARTILTVGSPDGSSDFPTSAKPVTLRAVRIGTPLFDNLNIHPAHAAS
jgi:hypothetical protein